MDSNADISFVKKTICLNRLVIFLISFFLAIPASPALDSPNRTDFLSVKAWKGTIHFKTFVSGPCTQMGGSGISGYYLETGSANVLLQAFEKDEYENIYRAWGSNPNAPQSVGSGKFVGKYHEKVKFGDSLQVVKSTVKSNAESMEVVLQMTDEQYEISISSGVLKSLVNSSYYAGGNLMTKGTTTDSWEIDAGGYKPFPSKGLRLSGSHTYVPTTTNNTFLTTCGIFNNTLKTTISWSLVPADQEEPELIVRIKDYQTWLPEAATPPNTNPGKLLEIQAELMTKDNRKAKIKADQITFTLEDTSREPGIAMNYPIHAGDQEYDFKFNQDLSPEFEISDNGQEAVSNNQNPISSGSVTLASFDWGAFTTLKVKAVLPDGYEITGHLENENDRNIYIPKRQPDSFIGDHWKKLRGVEDKEDEADDETKPINKMAECAGHDGDGLTLYEEYRGFISMRDPKAVNGHIYGEPLKKDLFISADLLEEATKNRAMLAMDRFEQLSDLAVHGRLTQKEIDSSRQINVNFNQGPHEVDQHGLIMNMLPSHKNTAEAVILDPQGIPTTPGGISHIAIGTNIRVGDDEFISTVIHEIMHGVAVWHHGFGDLDVIWKEGMDQGKAVILEEDVETHDVYPVEVFDETGTPVPPSQFNTPKKQTIGLQHGVYSGDEACVMRYDNATAYCPDDPITNKRVLFKNDEPPGVSICTSPEATGLAGKRYGSADVRNQRGACKYQICINDQYAASHTGQGRSQM